VPQNSLAELSQSLAARSHDEGALNLVWEFAGGFKKTAARIQAFNATGGLVTKPITVEQAQTAGFKEQDDFFSVLQGDVVNTESAYFMGERVCSSPKYVVLNSSCDLVPKRREYASLLRITLIRAGEEDAQAVLSLLSQFKKADVMYLPMFPGDPEDGLCNAVHFDGMCQIRSADLALANRIASLSVVGWRIFGCFSRVVIARANDREIEMRNAIEALRFGGTGI
jgi:hypothetical protein